MVDVESPEIAAGSIESLKPLMESTRLDAAVKEDVLYFNSKQWRSNVK